MKKASTGLWTIGLLLVLAFVFAMFQGGFVSWFLFYSFLPIALFCFGYVLVCYRGLVVDRKIVKAKYSAGEAIEVTLRFSNRWRIPYFYLMIEDERQRSLGQQQEKHRLLLFPWFKKEFSYSYELGKLPRGVLQWTSLRVHTGDLFGFIRKEETFPLFQEITIYPAYKAIYSWRSLQEKQRGSSYAYYQAEDRSALLGVREYVPGDTLTSIHWKASARTQRLQTKEFERRMRHDLLFFLDREQQAYGTDNEDLLELAVSVTASLSNYALQQSLACGFVSHGQQATVLPLSKEFEQQYRLLEHLAPLQADGNIPFVEVLQREINMLSAGVSALIISPHLDEKLVVLMAELKFRRRHVEFFWIKGKRMMNKAEQGLLALLDQEQVTYYVVETEDLNPVLAGGERNGLAQSF